MPSRGSVAEWRMSTVVKRTWTGVCCGRRGEKMYDVVAG